MAEAAAITPDSFDIEPADAAFIDGAIEALAALLIEWAQNESPKDMGV